MIYCKELDKSFATKNDMFLELKANAKDIISQKKSVVKFADGLAITSIEKNSKEVINALKSLVFKASNPLVKSIDYTKELNALPKLVVKATSNTTNWFDSHRDVHIDGIWNKTLSDNGQNAFPHIQEHDYDFENMIADGIDVKTYLENTTFKQLGFKYDGNTQALKFESLIDPNRNIFMYNQYANGWVKNHSVGMLYVNIVFCANSEMQGMEDEKANYDKYYPQIANKQDVDQVGYFWAVLEAKLKEHSAVVFGSNCITPTDSVEIEAEKSLVIEQAEKSLQQEQQLKELLNKFKK